MKDKAQNIGLRMVQEFASTEALSDKFLIFDNYTSPMEHLGTFAITGHPVKLDSLLIVICSEGYAFHHYQKVVFQHCNLFKTDY